MGRIRFGKRWRQDAERTNQLAKLLLEKRPQASALDGDGDDSTGGPPLSRIAGQVYFHGKIMDPGTNTLWIHLVICYIAIEHHHFQWVNQ